MPLRSGREYQKIGHATSKKEFIRQLFMPNQQPINLILLKEPPYSVNIDFDESSKAWRKNKISLGNGMFKYKRIIRNH